MTLKSTPASQRGAVLIMSLLILLILSILALSSIERTSVQERMVSAQRDADYALEMAEDALREAEAHIRSGLVVLADFNDRGPLYAAGAAPSLGKAGAWEQARVLSADNTLKAWSALYGKDVPAPTYFIELLGDVAGGEQVTDVVVAGRQDMTAGDVRPVAFRIVASSRGLSGDARRVVEVHYAGEL